MKLVVLNVAYPFAPVGPNALGGAEQLLTRLDSALACSGHESFVMACDGSVTEGILLATPKPSRLLDASERHHIHEQYRFTLQMFLEKWPIDLIHMHGPDFYEYLPSPGVPVLVTLHEPVIQYPETIFRLERPQTYLECSGAERSNCPPCSYLLQGMEETECAESSELHGARFLNAGAVDKYFNIYERLVNEARALETIIEDHLEPHLEIVGARA